MHNKQMEGPEPAHSLDANVALSTKNRSDLSDNAPYVNQNVNADWFVQVHRQLLCGPRIIKTSLFI